MRQRYLCPSHREETPSAIVYGTQWHCFGCGARGSIEQLGLKEAVVYDITPEDLSETFAYIRSLPLGTFRGLEFHHDSRGFYICWPNDTYYKYRLHDVDSPGGKYRSPFGVRKPPLILGRGYLAKDCLFLVEGEINALSLREVAPFEMIVSPGGAGDFYSRTSEKFIPTYVSYPRIIICVDNDKAGAQAGIEMKARLMIGRAPRVEIRLLDKDFNDILTQDGLNALETKYKEILEMS